jgi:hypothetical protein
MNHILRTGTVSPAARAAVVAAVVFVLALSGCSSTTRPDASKCKAEILKAYASGSVAPTWQQTPHCVGLSASQLAQVNKEVSGG